MTFSPYYMAVPVAKRRLASVAVAVTFLLGLLIIMPAAGAANIAVGGPSDCDSNAIINCGAHSTGALMATYRNGAYVRAVYSYFGINPNDVANMPATLVSGSVTSGGSVFVTGRAQPVATNAITGGRQNIAGSTPVTFHGASFFKRAPAVSFRQSELPAFVAMVNGRFQYAVIASCGNAVMATPVVTPTPKPAPAAVRPRVQPPPAAPQPQPAAPEQTQTQSQQVNVVNNSVNNNTVTPAPAATVAPTPTSAAPAATTTQPVAQTTILPNTGPTLGGVLTAAVLVGASGSFWYRKWLASRLA